MALGRFAASTLVRDSGRPLHAHSLRRRLPRSLMGASREANRLGIRVVAHQTVVFEVTERKLARVLGVDMDRRFLCAIVAGFRGEDPRPIWECTTLLDPGAGLLVTTTGHPMPLASTEVAQTLPGASPEELVSAHRAALEILETNGVGLVEVIDPAATAAIAHTRLGQPAREDRRGTARTLRANLQQGRHEGLGRLASWADVADRIAEIAPRHAEATAEG